MQTKCLGTQSKRLTGRLEGGKTDRQTDRPTSKQRDRDRTQGEDSEKVGDVPPKI